MDKLSILLLLIAALFSHFTGGSNIMSADEICDNGIDDDGDGLVDLNDTVDCFCTGLGDSVYVPASLIPNYSFEDTLCCPNWLVQLHCAKEWIQASRATSDYYHTCGYASDRARGEPPTPLPSGDAFVGFLDTWWLDTIIWKEYVGACLIEPMERGKDYRLQFYLGFGTNGDLFGSRSPFTIVLYGTTDCAELPFGDNDYTHCPAMLPEWFEIARVTLRGRNEWVRGVMSFIPNQDIQAVAIGSGCDEPRGEDYYFLDELILNERVSFDRFAFDIYGEECDSIVRLWTSGVNDIDYQWYRDGVAIQDANEPEYYILNNEPGIYVLRASDGTNCDLSDPFEYFPKSYEYSIDTTLCFGEYVMIGNRQIESPINETWSLKTVRGCDSVIHVNVNFKDTSVHVIDTSICIDEFIVVRNDTFRTWTTQRLVTTNHLGCDSIIYLDLRLKDTFNHYIDTQFCQGDELTFLGRDIASPGDHEFTLISNVGCDSNVTVRVDELTNDFASLDTFFCVGETVTISDSTVSEEGDYLFQLIGQHGCDSLVEWRVVARDNFESQLDTFICWMDSMLWRGQYFFDAGHHEDVVGGISCDSIFSLNLQIIDAFDFNVEDTIWLNCYGDQNATVVIETSGADASLRILWDDGSTEFSRSALGAGQYEFEIWNFEGCRLASKVVIKEPAPLLAQFTGIDPNCDVDSSGLIVEDFISGGTRPYQLLLNGTQVNSDIKKLTGGTYHLQIIDARGCISDTVISLERAMAGKMNINPVPSQLVVGDFLNLSINTHDIDSIIQIEWHGAGLSCLECLTWDFQPPLGKHIIEVVLVDDKGCTYKDQIEIEVIQSYYIPNAFTPNGDILNDVFTAYTDRSIVNLPVVRIFDRWGELVFQNKNLSPNGPLGWDGTFNGEKMEPGVYVYYIELEDLLGNVFTEYGDVTLLR